MKRHIQNGQTQWIIISDNAQTYDASEGDWGTSVDVVLFTSLEEFMCFKRNNGILIYISWYHHFQPHIF